MLFLWQGWEHWLGDSYKVATKAFLSFEAAQEFALTLKLSNATEWRTWVSSGER